MHRVALLFALVGSLTTVANATDKVAVNRIESERIIYTCSGKPAVGYRNGDWSPTTFMDAPSLRIKEEKWSGGKRYWTAYVKYNDWTYLGSADYEGDDWFEAKGGGAGRSFVFNTKTLKFTFVDTLNFFIRDPKGTAHMSIGTCLPASNG